MRPLTATTGARGPVYRWQCRVDLSYKHRSMPLQVMVPYTFSLVPKGFLSSSAVRVWGYSHMYTVNEWKLGLSRNQKTCAIASRPCPSQTCQIPNSEIGYLQLIDIVLMWGKSKPSDNARRDSHPIYLLSLTLLIIKQDKHPSAHPYVLVPDLERLPAYPKLHVSRNTHSSLCVDGCSICRWGDLPC